jgi:hypothetical protein
MCDDASVCHRWQFNPRRAFDTFAKYHAKRLGLLTAAIGKRNVLLIRLYE